MTEWHLMPKSLGFSTRAKNPATRDHDEVLASLIMFCANELSDAINYDHVSLPIPHFPVSLFFNGKYVDIAFIRHGRIFYVQMDSRKLPESLCEEDRENGKNEEQDPC